MKALRVVLPDQLDRSHIPAIVQNNETVLMAETGYLFGHGIHRLKLALLAAAGRHYATELDAAGVSLHHRTIAKRSHKTTLSQHVLQVGREIGADEIRAVRPGSWAEHGELERAAADLGIDLKVEEDPLFFATPEEFVSHRRGRKRLVMEYYYRELRQRHGVLMVEGSEGLEPAGGNWNYDKENRGSFGKSGPGPLMQLTQFPPDKITSDAIKDVREVFPEALGSDASLANFALPVTADDAAEALESFVRDRLARFGEFQDAMWGGEFLLYHAMLSPALNLHLLDPRDAVTAAEEAWRAGDVPINSAEGFIRQILGWREFVRGVYYERGPEYLEQNALEADAPLPSFLWDGQTRMECAKDVSRSLADHAYAHHIQRLMVMGLYALLHGANPREFHEWHLSFYLDAFDWVSAPNVIGMSQYADEGYLATKPYTASGKYIDRMSNYCGACPYHPGTATGDDACPFTTLYWDFLARHTERFRDNPRMGFQVRNLDRKSEQEINEIRREASSLRRNPK